MVASVTLKVTAAKNDRKTTMQGQKRRVKDAWPEVRVAAALGGHQPGTFDEIDTAAGGWQESLAPVREATVGTRCYTSGN
jgi:hypothetical protein